jgi:dihydroorotase
MSTETSGWKCRTRLSRMLACSVAAASLYCALLGAVASADATPTNSLVGFPYFMATAAEESSSDSTEPVFSVNASGPPVVEVSGSVMIGGSSPASRLYVSLRNETTGEYAGAQISSTGTFSFDAPSGVYELEIGAGYPETPGLDLTAVEFRSNGVNLTEAGLTGLKISLPATVETSVSVSNTAQEPLTNAHVYIGKSGENCTIPATPTGMPGTSVRGTEQIYRQYIPTSNAGVVTTHMFPCNFSTSTPLPIEVRPAENSGYINAHEEYTNNITTNTTIPITVPNGAPVSGSVMIGGSSPASRLYVSLRNETTGEYAGAQISSTGTFSFDAPSGVYELEIGAGYPETPGLDLTAVEFRSNGVNLTEAGLTGLKISLPATVETSVSVSNTAQEPLTNAHVYIGKSGENCTIPATPTGMPGTSVRGTEQIYRQYIPTSNAGVVTTHMFPCNFSTSTPLPIEVRPAENSGYINAHEEYTNNITTNTTIPITVPNGAPVSGSVMIGGSSPASRLYVSLRNETTGEYAGAQISSTGTFSFDAPSGVYELEIGAGYPETPGLDLTAVEFRSNGVNLTEAGLTGLKISLPATVETSVSVSNTAQEPLTNAHVYIGKSGENCTIPATPTGMPGTSVRGTEQIYRQYIPTSNAGVVTTHMFPCNFSTSTPLPIEVRPAENSGYINAHEEYTNNITTNTTIPITVIGLKNGKCTLSATVKLVPGLTDVAHVQAVRMTLKVRECSNPPPGLKSGSLIVAGNTTAPIGCAVLSQNSELEANSSVTAKWSPKTVGTSTGTAQTAIGEGGGKAVTLRLSSGTFAGNTLIGEGTELFTNGSNCGVPTGATKPKPITKGTLVGSLIVP